VFQSTKRFSAVLALIAAVSIIIPAAAFAGRGWGSGGSWSGSSTPTTPTSGVTIVSPTQYIATVIGKTETFIASVSVATPTSAVTCQISWGDGTTTDVAASPMTSGWACATGHYWLVNGTMSIGVTAVDASGAAIGSRSEYIFVF
jgi:hypothetical protein